MEHKGRSIQTLDESPEFNSYKKQTDSKTAAKVLKIV